ncbi:replication regulatory protein RepA (plasmid) [Yersinia pseudotuberculosis]|uniref:replication regulatory protein RepA n=1 Tax=Yersinia pseudotuberculosis TaxID=633 RepID=UPI000F4EEB81|nr:replication regulatory protein RepA [Yersinia pseudotuberculosis]AZA32600.1 replication regulatory protein RepA [Yersinia pseudotuberculosis]
MSQIENAVNFLIETCLQKGNPLTGAEKQRMSVSRKKETHKAINVFIQNDLKNELLQLCEDSGLTQTEMIERWIQREKAARTNAA